jgi:hypothetical protein
MAKHHIIITGTGRAGTTLLMQLLTALGLDTGFTSPAEDIYENCHAGMEWDLRKRGAPYIVKNPLLCEHLDAIIRGRRVVIDHAFIPIRDLYSAAESRRSVMRKTDQARYPRQIPGGLWDTSTPENQEGVLAEKLYELIYTMARHDIPFTLLHFPRLVRDSEYLYRKLAPALNGCEYSRFLDAFRSVVRPELVSSFRLGNILPFRASMHSAWSALKARVGLRAA